MVSVGQNLKRRKVSSISGGELLHKLEGVRNPLLIMYMQTDLLEPVTQDTVVFPLGIFY